MTPIRCTRARPIFAGLFGDERAVGRYVQLDGCGHCQSVEQHEYPETDVRRAGRCRCGHDYDYTVTLSASGIDDVTEDVTVTVLNRGALSVVCADPGSVYEGSADILFDCSASGVSSGTGYAYSWTARGNTQDTSLLSAVTFLRRPFMCLMLWTKTRRTSTFLRFLRPVQKPLRQR